MQVLFLTGPSSLVLQTLSWSVLDGVESSSTSVSSLESSSSLFEDTRSFGSVVAVVVGSCSSSFSARVVGGVAWATGASKQK